ncbi:hypothetical protein E5288_WYG005496 [Bos mutus]|uniref:Uncharacterized protein n=1 Tax=Bos mutus TaxID=72004 RepID=A0A6B0RNB6_9CETA|nr:hypothetical protein [Bos mutus]
MEESPLEENQPLPGDSRHQSRPLPGTGARGAASELSLLLSTGAQQLEPAGTGSPHTRCLSGDSRLQNCSETRQREDAEDSQTEPSVHWCLEVQSRNPELRPHAPLTSLRQRRSPGVSWSPELTGAGV